MLLDALYTNGSFYTQDIRRPRAHKVGVHCGRIISLDDDLPASLFRDVFDLGGAAVVPGFNDAHCHLSYVGQALVQADLRPAACGTMDELLAAVDRACLAAPEGAWVQGAGYDQNHLGNQHPTAEQVDAVSHGHPVWLMHNSRHMGVANTAAFERAGYPGRRNVTAPDGGAAPADADGRAVGLLQETARALVMDAIPGPGVEEVAEMVGAGSAALLELGVTSITEPGLGAPQHIGHSLSDIAGYQAARDAGKLGVRATVMPYLTTLHGLGDADHEGQSGTLAVARMGLDLGMRSGFGDEWLRLGPAKILSDGSLIGRSAFMCCDYQHEAAEPEGNRGLLQFPAQELRRRVIGAHRAGWQVATHAIGDAALDVVLDIFEEAQKLYPRPDARHRVEHVNVAGDDQIKRLASLGLIPVPQGRFISELGDGAARALGPERTRLAYRVKSLLDAGIEIPASTDAPVVSGDPLLNIHDLVNRRTSSGADFGPEERISVAQAVRAYTVGSAHAVHEDHYKGSLAPGMLADFVALSEDIYDVPADALRDVRVVATVVGGQLVHGNLQG
ncbi:amidohydrolase family protein [Pseudarthrobacter psychrotolerans]|uniref:Amidohydrolase family protein n=1 Tax=Pseudarthrobacter psychrotolerans TaxID=2697569 RepID=A0A6P1NQ10_9MICC|nr:amidohydrolase [Pseudarthrobacter psychrotolerans]QHK20644.1 amidohydrolase family protein [Pseudarthrobacter psychrotolerans]